MTRILLLLIACGGGIALALTARPAPPAEDIFQTSVGELRIRFLGHATLMMTAGGKVIHIDPVTAEADYGKLPKADLILITHEHGDHLDPAALRLIRKAETVVIANPAAKVKYPDAVVMRNGESRTAAGFSVEAVPAYNIKSMRAPGVPFHPRGVGNGYVLTIGDTRIFIAGDTENVPEIMSLRNIAVAFLPMDLPYTMSPEMAAEAARAIRPKVLYPYHYDDIDPQRLVSLLKGEKGVEVRVRFSH